MCCINLCIVDFKVVGFCFLFVEKLGNLKFIDVLVIVFIILIFFIFRIGL